MWEQSIAGAHQALAYQALAYIAVGAALLFGFAAIALIFEIRRMRQHHAGVANERARLADELDRIGRTSNPIMPAPSRLPARPC